MERTNPPIPKLTENISSDALFTFTSKLEYLVAMLKKGIYPRYIYERIPIQNRTWYYTVAAKCFCDIPLGKIKSHLNWFGNYGLGIKKTYLKEHGASPVLYMHNKSKWIVDALIKGGLENIKSYPTLPFLKRQSGQDFKLEEDGSYTPKVRIFYDEREWRYIPKDNDLESGDNIYLIKEGIESIRQKNIQNPYAKSGIEITPDVIEYVIIDSLMILKNLKRVKENFIRRMTIMS